MGSEAQMNNVDGQLIPVDTVEDVSEFDMLTSWGRECELISVFNGTEDHKKIPYLRWCLLDAARMKPRYPNIRIAYRARSNPYSQCCIYVPGLNRMSDVTERYRK